MKPFDLHMHSYMSDGTFAPEQIPELALRQGVELIALTDHDTAAGCLRAKEAGSMLGVNVICGMEIDTEYETELHILALGIDPLSGAIQEYERWRGEERAERNRRIFEKLSRLGVDAEPYMEHSKGNDTRLHIAMAIVAGGYASSVKEAFARYIGDGGPAYVAGRRMPRRDAVELAAAAGGVAVLAHPCKLKTDVNSLVRELADYGMWGLEVYYPISTPGQKKTLLSMAGQYGLVPTCGSDFHGKNRDTLIGCAYEKVPALERAFGFFSSK